MGKIEKLLGTGLGLAMAATAGAYLLYKKDAKFRRKTNTWATRMKREILETVNGLGDVNKRTFHSVVDQVGGRYKKMKEVNAAELQGIVDDLKSSWQHFSDELKGMKK